MQTNEKRQLPRFQKEYTVTFAVKEDERKIFNMYKLLDISKGGLRFFSYDHFPMGTRMLFYIKFPFLYPQVTVIEGQVVSIQDVMKGKTYKIGIHFINIPTQAIAALDKMQQFNTSKK